MNSFPAPSTDSPLNSLKSRLSWWIQQGMPIRLANFLSIKGVVHPVSRRTFITVPCFVPSSRIILITGHPADFEGWGTRGILNFLCSVTVEAGVFLLRGFILI